MKKNIMNFYNLLNEDPNHRYKSWEHCYSYFQKEEIEIDKACLHLSFYLASWGMYRGSSFLLWKDYLIHKKVVKIIIKNKNLWNIDFSQGDDKLVRGIFDLIGNIKEVYSKEVKNVNGVKKEIKASDTLVTKILLGTIGCIPAYDRFFIAGLKSVGIKPFSRLSESNFKELIKLYQNSKKEFDSVQKKIYEKSSIKYPIMKLIDMYFWQIGAENRLDRK